MYYKESNYGFVYGPLEIERMCSDDKNGWVHIRLKTKKRTIYLNVQKGGKIKFYDESGEKELILVEKNRP